MQNTFVICKLQQWYKFNIFTFEMISFNINCSFPQVDDVGGLAKVAIHQSIPAGNSYANSEEIVDYLNGKFNDRVCPTSRHQLLVLD